MLATLSVLAGILAANVVSVLGDFVLSRRRPATFGLGGVITDRTTLGIMLSYTLVAFVAGGWAAAAVGARRVAALIFALIMLMAAIVSTIVLWETTPPWYHVAVLILLVPAAMLGGRIGAKE